MSISMKPPPSENSGPSKSSSPSLLRLLPQPPLLRFLDVSSSVMLFKTVEANYHTYTELQLPGHRESRNSPLALQSSTSSGCPQTSTRLLPRFSLQPSTSTGYMNQYPST
ncbi:hypothetical protein M758_UG205200 [Ceratodon purpureus]|nr:hypothetical protein M758_UG205200 [Ceratodon purpureus]